MKESPLMIKSKAFALDVIKACKDNDKDGYTEGTIVKIFGIEVYNDVE